MAKMPSSDVDKSVGKRIKQARKEKGITVAELSELIDLAAQTISRYERGENKINLGHLFLIVKALQMPISWFFIDEEQNYGQATDNKLREPKKNHYTSSQNDLKIRLLQRWERLTLEQKRALIILLDTI